MAEIVRCCFYWKRLLPDETQALWRYSMLCTIETKHPPAVGDTILLRGQVPDLSDPNEEIKVSDGFEVIRRRWMHPAPGSYTAIHEGDVPSLDLVVVQASSLFDDEAPLTELERASEE